MNSRIIFLLSQYITRYAPSRERVMQYLSKKGVQNTDDLLVQIGYDEHFMLKMWIQTFINTGKSKNQIIQKLLVKKFPKNAILEAIIPFEDQIGDWNNVEYHASRFAQNKIAQGKSVQFVKGELFRKYPYFRDQIVELLSQYNDDSGLQKELSKALAKYDISDFNQKNKLFSALMRKGFQFDAIKNALSEREENLL